MRSNITIVFISASVITSNPPRIRSMVVIVINQPKVGVAVAML